MSTAVSGSLAAGPGEDRRGSDSSPGIEAIMEQHGARMIAAVSLALLLAQIVIGAIEQLRGLVAIYQGLVFSSVVMLLYVLIARTAKSARQVFAGYGALVALLTLAGSNHWSPWLEFPPLAAVMSLVILLQQWQRPTLAIRVFLVGLLFFAVHAAVFHSGMTASALWVSPVTAMTAGFVLGKRAGIAYALVTLSVLMALGAAGDAGMLATHFPRSPWYYVAVLGSLVTIAAYLGINAMSRYRQAFDEASELTRRLADEAREATAARLRMQAVFEANPLPSSILAADGKMLDCNRAWQAMSGIARENALGKDGRELGIWCSDEQYLEAKQLVAEQGYVADFTANISTHQGERQMLAYLQPLGIAQGTQYVSILFDQTDRLAAEAQQQALNRTLELRIAEANQQLAAALQSLAQRERLASLGNAVAGIAHELNTPIGNIVLTATTLQSVLAETLAAYENKALRSTQLGDCLRRGSEMAALIDNSAQRTATIVSRFKQLAIEQTAETRSRFNLTTVLESFLARQPLPPAGIEVHSYFAPEITCDSYPAAVEEVLGAILGNALVHAFAGRDTGTVRIAAHADGAMATVTVRDDGVGMEAPILAKIFDPFFTTRLGQGGSGLGLAIAHRITTTVLAGRLTASATPGAGSCFTLEFPCIAPGRI